MKTVQRGKILNGTHLKIIAMVCMVLDHMWATVIRGNLWMTCVGRIAFPIFAFQIAEGYVHTKNFKKYLGRLFVFGLISEIPYNLMSSASVFDPFSQNVMFTFCLALLILRMMDRAWQKSRVLGVVVSVLGALLGYVVGLLTFVDYYGFGILMVLTFWLFRGHWWSWIPQLIAMVYINFEMIGGMGFDWTVLGQDIFFPMQGFAVLALIPIWLYNGKRGNESRAFQYVGYAFYPAHILILSLLALAGVG